MKQILVMFLFITLCAISCGKKDDGDGTAIMSQSVDQEYFNYDSCVISKVTGTCGYTINRNSLNWYLVQSMQGYTWIWGRDLRICNINEWHNCIVR